MPKETLQFHCQACGMHAPIDALSKEHKPFAVFKRTFGGKIARTEAEKILLHGTAPKRGSGHGRLRYRELDGFARSIYIDQWINRLEVALKEARAMREKV